MQAKAGFSLRLQRRRLAPSNSAILKHMPSPAPGAASLCALLSGVIDYAGMFPPAKLPLKEAIRNYARYREESEAWMLGRFVCPVAQLEELSPFVDELFASGPPLSLAILGGSKVQSYMRWLQPLNEDRDNMLRFQQSHQDRVSIGTYELVLPPNLFPAASGFNPDVAAAAASDLLCVEHSETQLNSGDIELGSAYARLVGGTLNSGTPIADVVCESPLQTKYRDQTRHILFTWGHLARTSGQSLAFKLRCGGAEPSAYPSVEAVAAAIADCADAGVALKFTAGLHHPLRHFNASVQTHMHGFINIFVAAVLRHSGQRTDERQLWPIIADEDIHHFTFDDACMHWRDKQATIEQINAARRQVLSFGSCSFDEPRDDLRKLGWLP